MSRRVETFHFKFPTDLVARRAAALFQLAGNALSPAAEEALKEDSDLEVELAPMQYQRLGEVVDAFEDMAGIDSVRTESEFVEGAMVFQDGMDLWREATGATVTEDQLEGAICDLARALGGLSLQEIARRQQEETREFALKGVNDSSPAGLLSALEGLGQSLSPLEQAFLRDFRMRINSGSPLPSQFRRAAVILARYSSE